MTTTTEKTKVSTAQEVCIDLPGETVQCWRSGDNIKVVLRKHRDVIFDLKLGDGKTYTVQATDSDFYNARDKKLVYAKRKESITFKDGERLHLWVNRGFKGALLLKCDGKLLMEVEPNKIDPVRYDSTPHVKPAPLMVVMNNQSTTGGKTAVAAPSVVPTEAVQKQVDASMHVIEIKKSDSGLPKEVADFFKNGGEQTAVDTNGQLTRNWLWGTIAGASAYYNDNQQWIKELWGQKFYLQKIVHKKAGVKWYLVFKGNQHLRQYFTAARYGVTNSKVLSITNGAGSAAGLRHGAWDATKGTLKKASLFAVIFTITLDTAEWMSDYEQRDPKTGKPKKDFFDLVFKIGIDLAKAGFSAMLGAVAMGALVFIGVVSGGAAIVVGAIVLSVAIGFAIDYLDKKTGATDGLNKLLRDGANYLGKKLPSDYENYEGALQQAVAYGGMGA